jgi:MinD-like ATPase involved in chromosome partitioning or flagellar assembly
VLDGGAPELALASEPRVRAIQHLLLRFGVQSRVAPVAEARDDAEHCAWRLTVHTEDVAAFLRHVPLCGEQRERVVAAAGEPDQTHDEDAGPPSELYWDEVVSVRPAGEQQVWDLTVEPTQCFVANDIVVHNTTTALLAAGTLARAVEPAGKRVALVDANTAQSSISTILRRSGGGSIVDLVRTDVDPNLLAATLTPLPEAGALDVLFGAPDLRSADGRLVTPALYRRVVTALRRTHDYVIVDTPVAEAVGHELFDAFVLRDSDVLMVVLDPNRETIHNNVEWLDIIGDPISAGGRNYPAERIGIVLNRADADLAWNARSVGDHFRRFHFLGAIPERVSVQQAAEDARLLAPFDPAVERAVRQVLSALIAEPLVAPDAEPTAGTALSRLRDRLFGGKTRGDDA